MPSSPVPEFDAVLRRMFHRDGVDTLPAYLERAHGIAVEKMTKLDVGVFKIDQDDGAVLVVRMFSAARPFAAAQGDLAVLRHLAELDFPAERPLQGTPLTQHEGQAVLVTEFVKSAPKAEQPPHPIVRLGAGIGRLHGLPVPHDADRPAGALHHFAEGTMSDELRAAASWLDALAKHTPGVAFDAVTDLRAALDDSDGGDGLPEAFVHPDPVPKNAIFTAEGPVLIDWTSAGRGPRLASMTLVLRSKWAARPLLKGYTKSVTLTADERERLAGLLFSRALIDRVFRVCCKPESAPAAAKRLSTLRRDSDKQAELLLAMLA
ncbi:phosphotransferase enzyme family protein [Allobranchiibius sp. GilTou73]|uniref:phosphotransferase enzyme family protein n=1 Tax=Allobranchiibius sp. GilTou73 TaxID=2904523 RepID=UPI001F34BED2|nr:phosphotransferase [Allobranchiibius sp. GilTou73]UIJ33956.1 phosphotransferase [Allobranchiibius sp. GilTou73]